MNTTMNSHKLQEMKAEVIFVFLRNAMLQTHCFQWSINIQSKYILSIAAILKSPSNNYFFFKKRKHLCLWNSIKCNDKNKIFDFWDNWMLNICNNKIVTQVQKCEVHYYAVWSWPVKVKNDQQWLLWLYKSEQESSKRETAIHKESSYFSWKLVISRPWISGGFPYNKFIYMIII